MQRGTKRKPVAMREREGGTAGNGAVSKRRLPARVELATQVVDEAPPADLPREARRFWRTVVAGLIRIGMISEADRPAVETMCRHYARMRVAESILNEQGYTVLGSTGQLVPHPAHRIFNDASSQFVRYAVEFGLTPSSRVGLGLTEAARKTLQMDIEERLGYNPRKTSG